MSRDPRTYGSPQVSVLDDGRVALFVGGGYRYLTRAAALAYARQIVDRVLESSRRERAALPESRT